MTREDFRDWMVAYECHPEPMNSNTTGNTVVFVNSNNKGGYAYITTPINEKEMADNAVRHACNKLGIPYPECVAIKD